MSVVHIVKVTGKTKADLVKALHGAIRELGGSTSTTVNLSSSLADDEMEEVESPFTAHSTDEGVYGNGPGTANLSTVVDNELDAEGIPWDSRIHASTKTKNKDETWKLVKGVDKALVPQVKAELRARVIQANAQFTPPPMSAPSATAVDLAAIHVAPVVQTQPALPPQAAPALPPQMGTGHTLDSFKNGFALILSNLITQGKLTQDYVNTLKAHFGVAEVWQASEEQKAACFYEFVKCGLVQQVG